VAGRVNDRSLLRDLKWPIAALVSAFVLGWCLGPCERRPTPTPAELDAEVERFDRHNFDLPIPEPR